MSKEKSKIVQCMACGHELKDDHIGIKCIQDHSLCSECTTQFVSTIVEEPSILIPVKCSLCKQEIPSLIFERQLNESQLEVYNFYMIAQKLDSSEITKGCPHCSYFEI